MKRDERKQSWWAGDSVQLRYCSYKQELVLVVSLFSFQLGPMK